jgi:hypothetical protein
MWAANCSQVMNGGIAGARHEPEKTVLYEVVLGWLETFRCCAREAYERAIPRYVERELRRYLQCGILAHGFARAFAEPVEHRSSWRFPARQGGPAPAARGA